MKINEIAVGYLYSDNKKGLREVISLDAGQGMVRYKLLAAKISHEYDFATRTQKSLLGLESEITTQAFSTWAKIKYAPEEKETVLLHLKAMKLKLSPGEKAFMDSLNEEISGEDIKSGLLVSYDHTAGRAITGLEKKCLVKREGKGEIALLPLGVAYLEK